MQFGNIEASPEEPSQEEDGVGDAPAFDDHEAEATLKDAEAGKGPAAPKAQPYPQYPQPKQAPAFNQQLVGKRLEVLWNYLLPDGSSQLIWATWRRGPRR